MLVRALLLLAAAAVASSTIACSSLTKPDEIQIYAEPPPAPKPAAAPSPHGAAPGGAHPHAPGAPGG